MKVHKYWNFNIDQGGTFTDIIGIAPDKKLIIKKVLSSKNNVSYNPVIDGITKVKKEYNHFANYPINEIKIGTTIATNALLERKGYKVLLVVTKGFQDNFVIGTQQRNKIFDRHHIRKKNIYSSILEVEERITSKGKIISHLNEKKVFNALKKYFSTGIKSISITLINGFLYSHHEKKIKDIAYRIGFQNISCSYEVSPTINFTSRGFTTLVDAYLNPIIQTYVKKLEKKLKAKKISYMQSNGFLAEKINFNGKNAILSGPAGGVIGGIEVAKKNKIKKIIGFDMGGTSADIWHYDGEVEKETQTKISDIFIKTPMLKIDTIAAGGGSIAKYQNKRFVVGPESAGSFPGPACYRNNGPITLTDCNLVLGRIISDDFPKFFGKDKKSNIDINEPIKKLKKIFLKVNKDFYNYQDIYQLADSFLNISIENMSAAIKKITIQKGIDIRNHALLIFGSASGQYCCKVAEKIGVKKIIFSPYSGVLSAYGIGLSKFGSVHQFSVEEILKENVIKKYKNKIKIALRLQEKNYKEVYTIRVKYFGCNTLISIKLKNKSIKNIKEDFFKKHKKLYGFNYQDRKVFIDSIEVEIFLNRKKNYYLSNRKELKKKNNFSENFKVYIDGKWKKIRKFNSYSLLKNKIITGPAVFCDFNTTIFIEENWMIKKMSSGDFIISKKNIKSKNRLSLSNNNPSPEMLEIFNNLFFSVAEQMGVILKNTAQSINIKERMDFSCALFNKNGELIANAPHIPIHLGAMSDTIKFLIRKHFDVFKKGISVLHNNPFSGGTHLPDLTVVTPFLYNNKVVYYLANRAHHSDIGGITPGSMPAFSKNINEEGIVFDGFPILEKGKIKEQQLLKKLNEKKYGSRDPEQNLYDIKAQLASNQRGILELKKIISYYGKETVNKYVDFIKENCSEIIFKKIKKISNSEFSSKMDNGALIKVKINFDKKIKKLKIDFTGSSKQLSNNFNTPLAVTKSVIIYFLRTLITKDIPLNEGFLKDIVIIIPNNSMLNPSYPSPVVAGNVETSQHLIDILNVASKVQSACYGTMSNITFGDKNFGYYETICGGEGASFGNNGADAVHCHMTNTSITDPEILEWYYPVRLTEFSIRKKSGGKGKWFGGNGVIRKIVFLKNLDLTILSNRRIIKPFGIVNKNKAKTGENIIVKKNNHIKLAHACQIKVSKGDTIILKTPGGAGYN